MRYVSPLRFNERLIFDFFSGEYLKGVGSIGLTEMLGECCQDASITSICTTQSISDRGTKCPSDNVITGFTFLSNKEKHVRCCKR